MLCSSGINGLQNDLTKQWRDEKDDMERLQSIKEEIDRVNLEIQGAERDYDLNRAAELKYGTLLDLQRQLKGAEEALVQQVSLHELLELASKLCGMPHLACKIFCKGLNSTQEMLCGT